MVRVCFFFLVMVMTAGIFFLICMYNIYKCIYV